MVTRPVRVRVVLRQRRRVLAGQRRVLWDQTLFHSLLLLHPSVLEPNFHLKGIYVRERSVMSSSGNLRTLLFGCFPTPHLGLVKLQRSSDLNSPSSRQIFVEVEFFLEFRELLC